MAIDLNDLANYLTSFADGLGRLFGQNCEIALFSSKGSYHELIFVVNNRVTGRKSEDQMNYYELEAFKKLQAHNGHTVFSYTTREGRSIKAVLFIIGDVLKEEYMIMVISFDITDYLLASKVFQGFCSIDETAENKVNENSVRDSENITTLMERLVSEVVDEIRKPISYLSKEDKVKIVNMLNIKGIFLIKGSVEYVAEKLCVSRYTIYNYLEEIHKN